MKIQKLRFKNINSLRGEHEVDFEKAPLNNQSIFAIIGPTGSGKSSLLDVITLALFNRVPRISQKITQGKIDKMGAIVTHFAKDAFAEVTYESNGRSFRSKWIIAKAKTGNWKAYEMELAELPSGVLVVDKKTEVPERNEKIIGLSFDQFVKSILLSQGQFSKFLKADKNDRGQLLEDITGTVIYRKIGQKSYERAQEAKRELHDDQEKLKNADLLSEEEKTEIEKDVAGIVESIAADAKLLETLSREIQLKDKLTTAQRELEANARKTKGIEDLKVQFEQQQRSLEKHEAINPYREALVLHETGLKKLERIDLNRIEYQKKYAEKQAELEVAIAGMSKLCNSEVTEKNFLDAMKAFDSKVKVLDGDVQKFRALGKDLSERIYQRVLRENPIIQENLKARKGVEADEEIETALKWINVMIKRCEDYLKKRSYSSDDTEQLMESELAELRADAKKLADLELKNKELLKLNVELEELTNRYREAVSKRDVFKEKSTELGGLIKQFEESIKEKRKKQEEQFRIASFEEQRQELKTDEACPLCGSKDHPYAEHVFEAGKAAIELNKSEKQLVEARKEYQKLIAQLSAAEEVVSSTTDQGKRLRASYTPLEADLKLAFQSMGLKTNKKLGDLLKLNEAKIKELEDALLAFRTVKFLIGVKPEYQEWRGINASYLKAKKERAELYQGEDPVAQSDLLQNQFSGALASRKEFQTYLERDIIEEKNVKAEVAKILTDYMPIFQKIGYTDFRSVAKDLLTKEQEAQYRKINNNFLEEFAKAEGDRKRLNKEIELLLEKVDLTQNLEEIRMQHRELQIVRDNKNQQKGKHEQQLKDNLSRQKEFEKLEQGLRKKEEAIRKWTLLETYIGDATGNKFANFAQGLTLAQLIRLANNRLKDLSDRYLLDLPQGKENELRVIDTYQGDTSRAVNTLSGGESFLVSLALALSLSDLASRNVRLDSLFIDEGFGTLDQETLELALNTLERLQAESSKTIGVISHVESLKERIHTQIQLSKNSHGHSFINIVQN